MSEHEVAYIAQSITEAIAGHEALLRQARRELTEYRIVHQRQLIEGLELDLQDLRAMTAEEDK
jgi:hypothetical protein